MIKIEIDDKKTEEAPVELADAPEKEEEKEEEKEAVEMADDPEKPEEDEEEDEKAKALRAAFDVVREMAKR